MMNLSHEDRLLIKKINRLEETDYKGFNKSVYYVSQHYLGAALKYCSSIDVPPDVIPYTDPRALASEIALSEMLQDGQLYYFIFPRTQDGAPRVIRLHTESRWETAHAIIEVISDKYLKPLYRIRVDETANFYPLDWMDESFMKLLTGENPDDYAGKIVLTLGSTLVFTERADIEYKTAKGELVGKTKDWKQSVPVDERALFLDASFYTTIIRSEGFGVRGHFRLQPYKKDGEWAKKLIWIKPFNKSGYTRTAKKNIS